MKRINKGGDSTRDEDCKFSRRLRLLNKLEVVFLLLMTVITLSSIFALTHQKPQAAKKERAIKEVNEKATKDVRDSVTKEEPKAKKAKKP
jgi:hypothetical protein